MSPVQIVIIVLLAATVVLLIWIALRQRPAKVEGETDRLMASLDLFKAEILNRQSESMLSLRESLDRAGQALNDRLAEGTGSLDKRMAVLGEIEHRLGELAAQATHIEQVGKNIQSLSELLRPPKSRGSVGELLLENLLAQILPRTLFESQHRFSDGSRVDAVVKLADQLLPIDAKFPLEAFQRLQQSPDDAAMQKEFARSFRLHVDAIADKYIRPDEKTTNFAVMYIPAEAVYYQLVSQANQDGFTYAISKRVVPSSPGHLYAFLASMAALHAELSLAGGDFAENIRRIMARLSDLSDTGERLANAHRRMESSLRTLSGAFDKAKEETEVLRRQLEKVRQPLDSTTPGAPRDIGGEEA